MIIRLIRAYQRYISPYLYSSMGSGCGCRYYPSCSLYAIESIRKKGPLQGGLAAFWRILRCNPFSRGGYDPA